MPFYSPHLPSTPAVTPIFFPSVHQWYRQFACGSHSVGKWCTCRLITANRAMLVTKYRSIIGRVLVNWCDPVGMRYHAEQSINSWRQLFVQPAMRSQTALGVFIHIWYFTNKMQCVNTISVNRQRALLPHLFSIRTVGDCERNEICHPWIANINRCEFRRFFYRKIFYVDSKELMYQWLDAY